MKILVIRFKPIGDVVLTSVLCQTLKASFPNAQVDFLVYDIAAPLFEEQGFVDNVIGLASHVRKSPILFLNRRGGLREGTTILLLMLPLRRAVDFLVGYLGELRTGLDARGVSGCRRTRI